MEERNIKKTKSKWQQQLSGFYQQKVTAKQSIKPGLLSVGM